jgi:tetratricopeptide (TPR) repeat protein
MRLVSIRRTAAAAVLTLVATSAFAASEGRINGTVLDESGTPVAGTTVTISTPSLETLNNVLSTDERGKFSATVPNTAWTYIIRAEHEGFAPSQSQAKPPSGGAAVVLMTLHPPLVPPPPKIDPGIAAYNEGVELIQKDKAAAEKKFDEAVTTKPDLPSAWKAISQLAYERKDYAKTLSAGKKFLELDPKDKDLLGILMDSAQKTGDNAAAADYKKRFIEANADNPEVNYNAGVESYNASDFTGASASFNKAISLKPDMANAYFWLAMSEYNLKNLRTSRGHFQKYLEIAPQGDQAQNAKDMIAAIPAK